MKMNRMKLNCSINWYKLALISSILLIDICNAREWISIDGSIDGNCYDVTVLESSLNRYRARVCIHGILDTLVNNNNTYYHQLSLNNYCYTDELGQPCLPLIPQLLAIPFGKDCDINIVEESWTDIQTGTIYPAQEPQLDTGVNGTFNILPSAYSGQIYVPTLVRIGQKMIWQEIDNRAIQVCPFKYYPQINILSVLKEFIIEVNFVESNTTRAFASINDSVPVASNLSIFDNSNIILEGGEPIGHDGIIQNDYYDYLIISGNIYGVLNCQALKRFIKWKACKGFKVRATSTILIGSTTGSIKSYIAQEYQKGVRYVLLIGDTNKIPIRSVDFDSYTQTQSDYWYGCINGDGDYQADLYVGRFPTNDTIELGNMIDKTIRYESLSNSYGHKVLLCASRDGDYKKWSQEICKATYQQNLTFGTSYGSDELNSGLINKINAGVNIINYRGKGDYDCWKYWNYASESFFGSNVQDLNEQTNSIFFSIACRTGNIINNSMMESFLRSSHGAVSFLGPSVDVETKANNMLDATLFEFLLNKNQYRLGPLLTSSHVSCMSRYFSKWAAYNAFSYVCGGDPSLEIWTGTPNKFKNVTMSLNNNKIKIEISGINGFNVNVVTDDGSLLFKRSTERDSCNIPNPEEKCILVLDKHNYVPYVIEYDLSTNLLQNLEINEGTIFARSPLSIGRNVDPTKPSGNVVLKNGSSVLILNDSNTMITNGFEVEKGATLTINKRH